MTTVELAGPGYALPDGMVAEWRSSGVVAAVDRRTITVVAVPYDEDADVVDPDGRQYVESFDRKAFAGIETRSGRVPVNRDHDHRRTIGKAVGFHPRDRRGLVAELRMTPTPLGDETLALAKDDVLGASISFGVKPGGLEWLDRGRRRRITTAYLEHVALTPIPAYAGAAVIDVRHGARQAPPPPGAVPSRLAEALAWQADRELRSKHNID